MCIYDINQDFLVIIMKKDDKTEKQEKKQEFFVISNRTWHSNILNESNRHQNQ